MTSARVFRPLALAVVLVCAATACSSKTASPAAPSSSDGTRNASPTPPTGAGFGGARHEGGSGSARTTDGKTGTPAPLPPPPGEASQNDPPSPGTYRYRQDGGMSAGGVTFSMDPEGTLEVGAATLAPSGRRQRSTRRYTDSQELDQTLLFGDDAVWIESITQRFAGREARCEPEDPILAIRVPLEVGAEWDDESECGDLSLAVSAEVIETERRTVGGDRVDTFVVRFRTHTEGSGIDQRSTRKAWISPDHRLVVRSVEKGEGTANGIPFESDLTEDLVSLSPS